MSPEDPSFISNPEAEPDTIYTRVRTLLRETPIAYPERVVPEMQAVLNWLDKAEAEKSSEPSPEDILEILDLANQIAIQKKVISDLLIRRHTNPEYYQLLGNNPDIIRGKMEFLQQLASCLQEYADSVLNQFPEKQPQAQDIKNIGQAMLFWQRWVLNSNNNPTIEIAFTDGTVSEDSFSDFVDDVFPPNTPVTAASYNKETDTLSLTVEKPAES